MATSAVLLAASVEARAQVFDPAPPVLHELASMASPEPQATDELTLYASPRALHPSAQVEDWPGFMGPRRNLHSGETLLDLEFGDSGPSLLWSYERGRGYSSPVVVGERLVYTHRIGDQAVIDCLEASTGKRIWRHTYPCTYSGRYIEDGGPRATPAIVDDFVYVHGVDGRLLCLELSTGRVLWERNTLTDFRLSEDFFGVVSSPLIVGDQLIQNVGGPSGSTVMAFDRHSGAAVWGAGNEWGASCASPVQTRIDGRDKILVFAGGQSRPPTGGLLVVDLGKRALEASYALRSRTFESVNGATPVVSGRSIFLTASYGVGSVGLEWTAERGLREQWKNRHLGFQFSTPLLVDGFLYGVDGVSGRSGALVKIDPNTGSELNRLSLDWEESVENSIEGESKAVQRNFSVGEGSLLYADDRMLVLGDFGHLLVLDLSKEEARVLSISRLFLAPETWTPLVLSHGLLYVCQNNRARFGDSPARLLCYDLRGSARSARK